MDRAEKITKLGLEALEIEREDLITMKKNAWQKALLTEIITSQTSIPQKWVADQLHMGSSPYVCRLCKEMRTKLEKEKWLRVLKEKIVKIIT